MNETLGHIYLVDDDLEIKTHLRALLQRYGYEVSSYDSAEEFLNRTIHTKPAVMVLDMNLPGLSGVELQAQLNASRSFIPIIFISGRSQRQQIIDGFRGGAVDFLWKPFAFKELLKRIEDSIRSEQEREAKLFMQQEVTARAESLTPRERDFMLHMINGHTNKEIAELEGVTADNIKKYRSTILEKMQAESLAALIVMCRQAGITPDTGLPVDEIEDDWD